MFLEGLSSWILRLIRQTWTTQTEPSPFIDVVPINLPQLVNSLLIRCRLKGSLLYVYLFIDRSMTSQLSIRISWIRWSWSTCRSTISRWPSTAGTAGTGPDRSSTINWSFWTFSIARPTPVPPKRATPPPPTTTTTTTTPTKTQTRHRTKTLTKMRDHDDGSGICSDTKPCGHRRALFCS